MCAAAEKPGFLKTIYDANPRIQQSVTPLSSKDYISQLTWCEVAATRAADAELEHKDKDQGSADFKRALQDLAITLSKAHGTGHTVFVKWRSQDSAPGFFTTTYNVGFYPPELHALFIEKATNLGKTPQGFKLMAHVLTVQNVISEQGYRFYVPVPQGWTDESLMQAMVEQANLDPDHILTFGYDVQKKAKCNAPTGDMYFNFAPGGCQNHGSSIFDPTEQEETVPLIAITQPPSRFFVVNPETGDENHIKVRKAASCQSCWATPGRHSNCIYKDRCKMCLTLYADMEGAGLRHACGQGDFYRPKPKMAYNPNMDSGVGKVSAVAKNNKRKMEEGIAEAKAKRAKQLKDAMEPTWPDAEFEEGEVQDLWPDHAEESGNKTPDVKAAKTTKKSATDSPSGSMTAD
jgi:hypothetical protein